MHLRGDMNVPHMGGMIGLNREMTGIMSLSSSPQMYDHLYSGFIYPTHRGPLPS